MRSALCARHWAHLAGGTCPCPDQGWAGAPLRCVPSSADLPIAAAMALEKLVYRVKVAADRVGEQDRADGRAEMCSLLAADGTEGANRGQLR